MMSSRQNQDSPNIACPYAKIPRPIPYRFTGTVGTQALISLQLGEP